MHSGALPNQWATFSALRRTAQSPLTTTTLTRRQHLHQISRLPPLNHHRTRWTQTTILSDMIHCLHAPPTNSMRCTRRHRAVASIIVVLGVFGDSFLFAPPGVCIRCFWYDYTEQASLIFIFMTRPFFIIHDRLFFLRLHLVAQAPAHLAIHLCFEPLPSSSPAPSPSTTIIYICPSFVLSRLVNRPRRQPELFDCFSPAVFEVRVRYQQEPGTDFPTLALFGVASRVCPPEPRHPRTTRHHTTRQVQIPILSSHILIVRFDHGYLRPSVAFRWQRHV